MTGAGVGCRETTEGKIQCPQPTMPDGHPGGPLLYSGDPPTLTTEGARDIFQSLFSLPYTPGCAGSCLHMLYMEIRAYKIIRVLLQVCSHVQHNDVSGINRPHI